MNRTNCLTRLALSAVVALPLAAHAGGLGISEFSSEASGRGYAAAALYDDPAAVFYNPANVSRLEGVNVAVGAAAIMPRFSYTPIGGMVHLGLSNSSVIGMCPALLCSGSGFWGIGCKLGSAIAPSCPGALFLPGRSLARWWRAGVRL